MTYYILYGSGWYDSPDYCRVAFRDRFHPDYRFNSFGFRLTKRLKQ